ncbi:hypothetical protein TBH_C1048 [Thiolapillus brandeum]|uniref:Uncharacterized protein n=1 Tax=Thiolapillus brandeum TaxID=1076588 RepID=A0A7U6GI09_9GAMM|nr:hypothetical protein TBH_C1048 [Thiolapillus brandeum]
MRFCCLDGSGWLFHAENFRLTIGPGFPNRMLKKSFHGLFQLKKTKMRFCLSSIFNDLKSLKMAAHPCAAFRLPKNGVFQQPAKWLFDPGSAGG